MDFELKKPYTYTKGKMFTLDPWFVFSQEHILQNMFRELRDIYKLSGCKIILYSDNVLSLSFVSINVINCKAMWKRSSL